MIQNAFKNKKNIAMILVGMLIFGGLLYAGTQPLDFVRIDVPIIDTQNAATFHWDGTGSDNAWTAAQEIDIPEGVTGIDRFTFYGLQLDLFSGSSETITIKYGMDTGSEPDVHPEYWMANSDGEKYHTSTYTGGDGANFYTTYSGAYYSIDPTQRYWLCCQLISDSSNYQGIFYYCDADTYSGGNCWNAGAINMDEQNHDMKVKCLGYRMEGTAPPTPEVSCLTTPPINIDVEHTFLVNNYPEYASFVPYVYLNWKADDGDWSGWGSWPSNFMRAFIFTTIGSHTVYCKARESFSNKESGVGSTTFEVYDPGQNNNPVCDLEIDPLTGGDIETVYLFTDESTDEDGQVELYRWDFGDNTATDSNEDTSHQYSEQGTYTVRHDVWDDDGGTDWEEQILIVGGINPDPIDITVTSKDSDQAILGGVTVILTLDDTSDTWTGTTHATTGTYTFQNRDPGSYRLTYSKLNYGTENYGPFSFTSSFHTHTGYLTLDLDPPVCPNGICESDKGETAENCPEDCGGGVQYGNLDLGVYDSNNMPIAGVEVTLTQLSVQIGEIQTTDEFGLAYWTSLPFGDYRASISKDGFEIEPQVTIDAVGTYNPWFELQMSGGSGDFVFDTNLIIAIVIASVLIVVGILLAALLPIGIGWRIAILILCIVFGIVIFLLMTVFKIGFA